jgi:transmembrane sensor
VTGTDRIGFNRQVNEEASYWFVEFRSGDIDAAGRRAFDAWVRASPEHLRAFIEVAALWDHPAALDPGRRFSVETLIASVREAGNVIPLSRPAEPARPCARKRGWIRVMAAAVLLFIGSLIAWSMFYEQQTYSTQVGEQRSLRLRDGSLVTLNSRSRARIEFTDKARVVDLLQGEALFHVAKDTSRPFVVRAEGTLVRAVGTEFDVKRRNRGTVVTVVEGRVAISMTSAPGDTGLPSRADSGSPVATDGTQGGAVYLSAGEQLDVAGSLTHPPARTNVSSATAWMQGKVILQSATLEEVAEEFNRYSTRRLTAEDRGSTPFRLSGVFSTDPDFLIRYLHERPDIQVRENATEIHIVRVLVN